MIKIRTLTEPAELNRLPHLERAIWGNDDPVPTSMLRVMVALGGEISIAYREEAPDEWLGFTASIGGYDEEGPYLYSHQAGVLPPWQHQGIGRLLKYHQNRWAERAGYRRIRWTFDPLRALNAHFNVGILGVNIQAYHPDYYGNLSSVINRGLATDRLLAEWSVPAPMARPYPPRVCFKIYIPADIGQLKVQDPGQAARWQRAVRSQFCDALAAGYHVVGFSRHPSPAYLFAN
ncbi:GNAT family N-acetyltransferase [Sulfobacillus harzensis]|uniref:GNAT family N-acetyltransferase n=1 Tax=Sulfobacillus harzensis TaxID=2729629 RepID=A0A7Y0L039_9FIRM|nr:GNAT family N-acetyltransferase [Sulfobacillus harzensis]NMP20813.1 GNAT family N-acetyltransferase [Sulfobacillus harzensis]